MSDAATEQISSTQALEQTEASQICKASCLNENGVVFLTTGDRVALCEVVRQELAVDDASSHTFFFSPRTLTRLSETLNYKVETVKRPWKFVPLSLAIHQIGSRLN
jgi:hypothetical protein